MRKAVYAWGPLTLVLLAAFWLRTADLGRRPMHADEANQAVKTGILLETGHYVFDPRDHHGPTLYYAALPIAWLRGQHTLSGLDEVSVRLVPALAGTLGVLLLALLAQPLGRWPALAAAALLAVSPPAVYFSRYFIQETLLVTFTLSAFVCAQQWIRTGLARWAATAGACSGLMLATKASAPVFLVTGLIAFALSREKLPATINRGRAALFATLAAFGVAAVFYSSFGWHFAGLYDAGAAYGRAWMRATGDTGHEKPWWYYLQLFAWQRTGGLTWEQLAVSVLCLAGFLGALVRENKLVRQAASYTALVGIVLSLTPYKTPWHVIHLVPGLALLAASVLALIPSRVAAVGLVAVVLFFQARQTWLAAFLRPADARNPYAYVHSSPDVLKFRALAENAQARRPGQAVRIIGDEYWPLPWYLRGLPNVGYWNAPPATCDGALVVSTLAQPEAVRARLHGPYDESFLGLRPDVICILFTPRP